MLPRILDLAEQPCMVSARGGLLVVRPEDSEETTLPMREVAALLLSHPQSLCTQAALAQLSEAGGIVVVCGANYMPVALQLPLHGHYAQTTRFRLQAAATKPTNKRIWQRLVIGKIRGQAHHLESLGQDDVGLRALARRVRSGDPENIEAQAARRYWRAWLGESFRRDPMQPGVNAWLNYTYAVLRAITARAVCGAGLHPGLGVQHHGREDPMPLISDVMEPFRPHADKAVASLLGDRDPDSVVLERDEKQHLIERLLQPLDFGEEQRSPFDALSRTAVSIVRIYEGETERNIQVPDW